MSEQLQTIKKLIDLTPSPRWRRVLDEMYVHMRLPMQDVLEKVPGDFVRDKIAAIGVSRNTYYEWMREGFRPNRAQAAKLAKITGYSADAIHGQTEDNDDTRRATAKKAAVVASRSKGASRVHGRAQRRLGRSQRARRVAEPLA